ncbi:MAG TPA: prepilin peptidase [Candidatus Nanoarchaeia archaeon]|nr:prepilin peptidase [Candidatus Nanoarchaeia archaeon]
MAVELVKYGFLFFIALIWMVFATVQDIKKREVANWLNFSLVAFALAYRAFYSSYISDWMFFVWGLIGFVLFFGLGNLFYYSNVFAGGDAKLLMGLGVVLPVSGLSDMLLFGLGFVLLLFFVGAIYSLIYSVFIIRKNYSKFSSEFEKNIGNRKNWVLALAFAIFLVLFIYSLAGVDFVLLFFAVMFAVFVFILLVYAKSLEVCLIKLVSPGKLTEGDWILEDIKLGRGVIKKTVHGLNAEDIMRLKKKGKKVLIREGIPFVPAFLMAFLIMVFFSAVSGFDLNLAFFLS